MLGSNVTAAAAASSSGGGFNVTTLIFIAAIVLLFYMLMIRPQQRRRQQAQQQANTLAPGAEVVTTAGMYATVTAVDGDDVILEVAPGCEVRYMKRAIMNVVSPAPAAAETVEDEPEADAAGTSGSVSDVADSDAVADAPEAADSPSTDDADSAYERATGTKKD